jgi:hypothetical protein
MEIIFLATLSPLVTVQPVTVTFLHIKFNVALSQSHCREAYKCQDSSIILPCTWFHIYHTTKRQNAQLRILTISIFSIDEERFRISAALRKSTNLDFSEVVKPQNVDRKGQILNKRYAFLGDTNGK